MLNVNEGRAQNLTSHRDIGRTQNIRKPISSSSHHAALRLWAGFGCFCLCFSLLAFVECLPAPLDLRPDFVLPEEFKEMDMFGRYLQERFKKVDRLNSPVGQEFFKDVLVEDGKIVFREPHGHFSAIVKFYDGAMTEVSEDASTFSPSLHHLPSQCRIGVFQAWYVIVARLLSQWRLARILHRSVLAHP